MMNEFSEALADSARVTLSYETAKRLSDVVIAAVLLVLSSPLILVLAALIKLDSAGPVFFRQRRLGRSGEWFEIVKLRTMIVGAEESDFTWPPDVASRESALDLKFHPDADPRVTRLGRLLRAFSLDELPNLLNVLKGEMSMVGPRPLDPKFIPLLGEAGEFWLSLQPGVTSLSKIRGRDTLCLREAVQLERAYSESRSLWFDLLILIETLPRVVLRRGSPR